MFRQLVLRGLLFAFVSASIPQDCRAAGGTSRVAMAGEAVYENPHWPDGVAELLRHRARGDGWNDWFTEWPSDVNHYEFRVKSTAQLNAVIERFAQIEQWEPGKGIRVNGPIPLRGPDPLEIRLCPSDEPAGLGWVTRLPEGNDIPVLFSIGDQRRVDQWYRGLPGGKFGVMHFTEVPVAVPPTLTIFVGHQAVDLDKLRIPQNIRVIMGGPPRFFRRTDLPTVAVPAIAEAGPNSPGFRLTASDAERGAFAVGAVALTNATGVEEFRRNYEAIVRYLRQRGETRPKDR